MANLFPFLMLMLSATMAFSPALHAMQAQAYEEALISFSDEKYKRALIQLKNALQEHPDSLPTRILLGRTHLALGAGPAAQKEFEYALRNGADTNLIRVPLAKAYMLQGKFKELLNKMEGGARRSQIDAEILTLRGKAYFALGELDKAERELDTALRLQPDNVSTLIGQAGIKTSRGDLDAAEDVVDIATEIAPENPQVWYQKGELRQMQGELEMAHYYYSNAIELDSRYVDARIGRAGTLIDLGREQEALEDIDFVLNLNPVQLQAAYLKALVLARNDRVGEARDMLKIAGSGLDNLNPEYMKLRPPLLLIAGIIKYAEGSNELSRRYLTDYLSLNPSHLGARKVLGKILLQIGDLNNALSVLEPAYRIEPKDIVILALLGETYLKSKQYDRATGMFEQAASLSPERPELRTQLALSRLARGQDKRAVKELEAVLAKDAGDVKAGLLLGYIHLRQGDQDQAISDAAAVIKLNPNNPAAYNLMGVARLNKGDLAGARDNFETALSHDSSYVAAQRNLAKIDFKEGDLEMAKIRYNMLIKNYPNDLSAMLQLARIAERENRIEDAVGLLEKLRSRQASPEAVSLHLIDLYVTAGKPQRALSVLDELQRMSPASIPIQIAKGRLLLQIGQHEKAIVALREVSQFIVSVKDRRGDNKQSATYLRQIAGFQMQVDDFDAARYSLQNAIVLAPKLLSAQAAMVKLDTHLGKYDTALKRAKTIKRRFPESSQGEILTGDILMRSGRFGEAERAYAAAQRKHSSLGTAVRLYQVRRKAHGDDKALQALERWVQDHPHDQNVRRALAIAYIETGRFEAAVDLNQRLIEESPDDPVITNNLAWVYSQMGDPRAVEYAKRAYQLSPSDPAAADTYGWILVLNDEPAQGLKYLREAHVRTAKEPQVRYHLAVALTELGRLGEARKELREALKLSEDFEGADQARSLLVQLTSK